MSKNSSFIPLLKAVVAVGISQFTYAFMTIVLHYYYINITYFIIRLFPLAPTPLTPYAPSFISLDISLPVTNLWFSVSAIFSATINGSTKSINILPGEEAKSAPADIIPS